MKSHDLNILTNAIATRDGITFAEARRRLGQRGAAARNANRRRTQAESLRVERARAIAERISP